jgi:hypothetical protein
MILLPFVLKTITTKLHDCYNFDGILSPYHINKLMLSLFREKRQVKKTVLLKFFKENNWNVYFGTTNVEIENHKAGIKL